MNMGNAPGYYNEPGISGGMRKQEMAKGEATPETVEIEIEYALVVQLAQRTMQLLSAEQRLTFLKDIAEGYCRHCGDPQPKDRICQCWNDE